jgi:hypothetical protein
MAKFGHLKGHLRHPSSLTLGLSSRDGTYRVVYALLERKIQIQNHFLLGYIRIETNALKEKWKVAWFFAALRQPFLVEERKGLAEVVV